MLNDEDARNRLKDNEVKLLTQISHCQHETMKNSPVKRYLKTIASQIELKFCLRGSEYQFIDLHCIAGLCHIGTKRTKTNFGLPVNKTFCHFRPREPDASHLSPTYSDIDYTDDDLVSNVCFLSLEGVCFKRNTEP